jgi:hypothetical protein
MQWSSEREEHLRDYAALAGSVMQLAAYTCGDMEGSTMSMRSSGASVSDENCNAANRDAGGLMSPGAAALALQRGTAGTLPLQL